MKLPGPDHPIAIAVNPKRVRVSFAGQVIADTRGALTMKETTYPAVQYIPRADVAQGLARSSDVDPHQSAADDAARRFLRAGTAAKDRVDQAWTLGLNCIAQKS